jgi:5-formyltetrahydrofolate cyclo-ligase
VADRVRQSPQEPRRRWDEAIQTRLLAHPVYREARCLHCYLSLTDEVATERIVRAALADHKRIVVPVVEPAERRLLLAEITESARGLVPGAHGILEPPADGRRLVEPSGVDLFIVPGVVFDANGCRLGRGLGYYDRYLAQVKGRAVICALAYELQIIDRLPTAPHDVPMDFIVTEKRVIEVKGKK